MASAESNRPRVRWEKPAGHWELVVDRDSLGHSAYTLEELAAAGPQPAHESGDRWGPWVYDAVEPTLTLTRNGVEIYSIELETLRNAPTTLHAIGHMAAKGLPSEVLGSLVVALHDLLDLRRVAGLYGPGSPAAADAAGVVGR